MVEREVGRSRERFRLFDPVSVESGPVTEIILDLPPAIGADPLERGLRVAVIGEVTGYTTAQLWDDLLPIVALADPLIVDLSGVTRFDGGGAAFVQALRDDLSSNGSYLVIESPSGHVASWLHDDARPEPLG